MAMYGIGPFGGLQGESHGLSDQPKKLDSITIYSTKNAAGGQVSAITFSYTNSVGKTSQGGPWGINSATDVVNTVNIPTGAYVVELSGTVQNNVKSLAFITSTGDTFGPFGDESAGKEFKVPMFGDGAILGFFGRSGTLLNAVGVYVGPNP